MKNDNFLDALDALALSKARGMIPDEPMRVLFHGPSVCVVRPVKEGSLDGYVILTHSGEHVVVSVSRYVECSNGLDGLPEMSDKKLLLL